MTTPSSFFSADAVGSATECRLRTGLVSRHRLATATAASNCIARPNSIAPSTWSAVLSSLCGIVAVCGWSLLSLPAAAAEPISFNRDIRPLLSDNCFICHGPDETQREAGLQLDVRELALNTADSGERAIVPGKPDSSELVRRLFSEDPSERMPPADSGKSLTGEQRELLRRWVAEGAEYQGHWAFITPTRPALPDVQRTDWIRNPIDRFVLRRLEQANLAPSREADRATLIRRVTLDLTGLPPTPDDVAAFVADESPDAYERLVDRLLASPQFGERLALPWLDFARYADSNGYQTDGSRFQWPWRDWVIDAFNRNQSFDRFTVEQLAGDMLPDATPDQIVATGFNRNHRLNGEGGIIAEEWRVETVIDRVETTGLTWLGLTLNCCRCHDHKYDPISRREFYQLFAFFNNVPESGTLQGDGKNTDPVMQVVTAEHEADRRRLEEAVRKAEQRIAESEKRLPELVAAWEPEFKKQLESTNVAWQGLSPREVKSSGGANFERQDDGTYLAGGTNAPHDTYEIVSPIAAGSFSGLLLECFPDARLPNQSLGRYPNGNFVLTRVEAEITAAGISEPRRAKFSRAEADFSQKDWEIKFVNNGNKSKGWAVDGPTKREPRRAIFVCESPLEVPADATLTVRLFHEAINQHNIGRFRLSVTSLPPDAVKLDGPQFPASLREALATAAGERTPAQQSEIAAYYRANIAGPLREADAALIAAKEAVAELGKSLPNVMVMREGPPRDAFMLTRGQYDLRSDKVDAGLPSVLPSLPEGQPMNRLGLAEWMVDRSNPLTARVFVNRVWERLFGVGIVKTSENLGSQSEFPSHPDLLDWLACEFMEPTSTPDSNAVDTAAREDEATSDGLSDDELSANGWDVKSLHRMIVTSAAYRQSSRAGDSLDSDPSTLAERIAAVDPDNRLLSRAPRFRLSGEVIRDQALAASGLLVRTIGGPSVRPYMPDGVWDETSRYGDLRNYQHDKGPGLYRRTMYTIWKRTAAPPTMLLFDAPNREVCTVKRSRTNTPLQALSLLNEVTFVEAARKLAERMLTEAGPTVDERIAHGFRLTVSREPTDDELSVLRDGLAADLARFQSDADAVKQLLAVGEAKAPEQIDRAELAAYTLTANVLFNLDEFVTRE